MAALTAAKTELVLIDYDDLVNARNDADTAQKIKFAFGKDGLGVLAVTNVPQELRDQRLRLLGIARRLGTLPEETLAKASRATRSLTAVTQRSRLHVGRLLHYYPRDDAPSGDDAAWCGWHNDNSVITALAPAIYFDDATGESVGAPAGAGLLAFSRSGAKVRVGAPPEGSILFQIGEAAQILSGGTLVATPHAVAAGDMARVSRESFALFVEPDWDEAMQVPTGCSLDAVLAPDDARADIIPPMRSRLTEVPVAFLTDPSPAGKIKSS
ncbi:hypothetical protein JL722_9327 [Aureococcus anophagefferens]|nr:hypothetical protein JL722_9327 [Aureococcus anophagefferens]